MMFTATIPQRHTSLVVLNQKTILKTDIGV